MEGEETGVPTRDTWTIYVWLCDSNAHALEDPDYGASLKVEWEDMPFEPSDNDIDRLVNSAKLAFGHWFPDVANIRVLDSGKHRNKRIATANHHDNEGHRVHDA